MIRTLLQKENKNDVFCNKDYERYIQSFDRQTSQQDAGFTLANFLPSPNLSPEVKLFNAVTKMIDYLSSMMYANNALTLQSVGINHQSQAFIVRQSIAQISHLLGVKTSAQKDRLNRWLGVMDASKTMTTIMMPRGSGKSTGIEATAALAILNYEPPELPAGTKRSALNPNFHAIFVHQNFDDAADSVRKAGDFTLSYGRSTPEYARLLSGAKVTQRKGFFEVDFGNYSVSLEARSGPNVRGRHPDLVFVDELLKQSDVFLRSVLYPILFKTDVKQKVALCFSTPAHNTDSEAYRLMTDPLISTLACQSLVCNRTQCNDCSEAQLKCIHRYAYLKPWYCTYNLAAHFHSSDYMKELVENRCLVSGIQVNGFRKDLLESLLTDVAEIELQNNQLVHSSLNYLQASSLTVAIDPDMAGSFSKLGVSIYASFTKKDRSKMHLLLCATSIDSMLRGPIKQQIIYTLLKSACHVFKPCLQTISETYAIIESNCSVWAAGPFLTAISAACEECGLGSVMIAKHCGRIDKDHVDFSVQMTPKLKQEIFQSTVRLIEKGELRLPSFMVDYDNVQIANQVAIFNIIGVSEDISLIRQLKQTTIKPTQNGFTYSGKTNAGSDDIAMSFMLGGHACDIQQYTLPTVAPKDNPDRQQITYIKHHSYEKTEFYFKYAFKNSFK